MIDSYLEQCKQAGRELAIKEASLLTDSLALLGGSAALGAGVKAMSRNKALKTLNRGAGAAGGALAGGGLGISAGLGVSPLQALSQLATYRSPHGFTHLTDDSLLGAIYYSLSHNPSLSEQLTGVLPYGYAPMLLGGYAGTKLVKGSEKLQPILAKKLRS